MERLDRWPDGQPHQRLGGNSPNGFSAWAINDQNQVTGVASSYAASPGYPTPYVADVTHAFDSLPSVSVKWLPFCRGQGVSINANGCVVAQGADAPSSNCYYDGGDPALSSSYANPMAVPAGLSACYTSAINDAGYALCTAPLAERLCGWVDDTVAGSRITAYDRDVPAVAAGGTSVPRALNNSPSPTIVGFGFPTQADAIADDTANQRALIWTYGSFDRDRLDRLCGESGRRQPVGLGLYRRRQHQQQRGNRGLRDAQRRQSLLRPVELLHARRRQRRRPGRR